MATLEDLKVMLALANTRAQRAEIQRKISEHENKDVLNSDFITEATDIQIMEENLQKRVNEENSEKFKKQSEKVEKIKNEIKNLKAILRQSESRSKTAKLKKQINDLKKDLDDAQFVKNLNQNGPVQESFEKINFSFDSDTDSEASEKHDEVKLVNSTKQERQFKLDLENSKNIEKTKNPDKKSKWSKKLISVPDNNIENYKKRTSDLKIHLKDPKLKNINTESFTYQVLKSKKVPGWKDLYEHQKQGVTWLWKLHRKQVGGIVGDEMGLGKTIQICQFFSSLHYSQIKLSGSKYRGLGTSIIICPATLIYQWVKELHKWFPLVKVIVIHNSTNTSSKEVYRQIENSLKSKCEDESMLGIIVVTTYARVRDDEFLTDYQWHYVVLDEGHQVKNPDSKTTQAIKLLRTAHRIVLTGTPIQNNLRELWCLVDFCYPGLLGTLPVFTEHVAYNIEKVSLFNQILHL